MSKVSLTLLGIIGLAATVLTFSLHVHAQSATRIEYLRVTSYTTQFPNSPTSVQTRTGYRACVAAMNEWNCREFPPNESSGAALRNVFVTLGNDGWELVTALVEQPASNSEVTYLFKRQAH